MLDKAAVSAEVTTLNPTRVSSAALAAKTLSPDKVKRMDWPATRTQLADDEVAEDVAGVAMSSSSTSGSGHGKSIPKEKRSGPHNGKGVKDE